MKNNLLKIIDTQIQKLETLKLNKKMLKVDIYPPLAYNTVKTVGMIELAKALGYNVDKYEYLKNEL